MKSREKKRLNKLNSLKENMNYQDYKDNHIIFSDDYLYYSSYELFMTKSQRKLKGLSYISDWIIYFMVDKTVNSWLKKNKTLNSISILDPCCKSGSVTQIIIEYLLIKFKKQYPEISEQELLIQIIQNNVHSWDSNEEALTICRNRIKNIFNVEPLLVKLINPFLENKKFDIIIGNPYYGDLLSKEFKISISSPHNNIVLDILDWSYKSIFNTGEVCLIVPHNLTFLKCFEFWRKTVHDNLSLHTLVDTDISFQNIFENNVILGFNKEQNKIIESSSFKNTFYKQLVPINLFYNRSPSYKMNIYLDKEKFPVLQFGDVN